MANSVVITGIGAITPLGNDAISTWQAILQGRSGITQIMEPWADQLDVRIAGQVDADLSQWFSPAEMRHLDRVTKLALVAAREAWADAGFDLNNHPDEERVSVCLGSGIGGLGSTIEQTKVLTERGAHRVSPFTVPSLMMNAPAAQIGLEIGAKASVHAPVSACASGADAIALGLDQIRLGRADVVVVGGSEATVVPLALAAFGNMGALSKRNADPKRASRPWDAARDGFVLSEGAAVLVLEREASARERGAQIYANLVGSGVSADGYDIVAPDPTAEGPKLAMRRALADADLSAADVLHVNAHATSTPQGDLLEAKAISEVLRHAPMVTSTKSSTGHLLGAAGALEALVTALTLRDRVIPPTINLSHPSPGLQIDVATEPHPLPDGDLLALSNSFGFGGHNVCLAMTNAASATAPVIPLIG